MSSPSPDIASLPYRPCVGLMMLSSSGRIFAGQRLDMMVEGWQMPQGGVDEGETPIEAALRELGEEVGLRPEHVEVLRESGDWIPYDLPVEIVPKVMGGRWRGQTQKWFALRFVADDSAIRIDTEEPEFRDWAWLDRDELMSRIVPFKRSVYEKVFSEFSDLLS